MPVELDLDFSLRLGDFRLEMHQPIAIAGVTALFGASGSGKTSVLRTIAGLERQAQGSIRFDGRVWQSTDERLFVPPHKRAVGYVFQEPRLFSHLNVAGNLGYAARRSRVSHQHQAEVIDSLDLATLLSRRPASLSGGERQRVALGRALLTEPQLLLLDEPLAALDQRRKAEILPYLLAVTRRFNLPSLFVSHAIDEVAQLADRTVILDSGQIVAEGQTAEMLERLELQPLTGRFEAGVVLETRVVSQNREFCLTHLDLAGQNLTMPMLDHLQVGDLVRVRVRARDVALATIKPEGLSIRNVVTGHVAEIVSDPATAFAEILVDTGGARLRARITRQAAADLDLTQGKAVYALVKSVSFDRRGLAGIGEG